MWETYTETETRRIEIETQRDRHTERQTHTERETTNDRWFIISGVTTQINTHRLIDRRGARFWEEEEEEEEEEEGTGGQCV